MQGLTGTALFQGLSNTSDNVYLFEHDMRTNFSHWSDNAVSYFGLPADYANKTLEVWMQHIHPDDRKDYMDDIGKVFGGLQDRHYCQYRARNAKGDYVWMECSGNVVKDENGQPTFFVGLMTRLDHQSKYDPVTKCPSMLQFYQTETPGRCVLLLVGMDGFRRVVNNFGYAAGNEVLIAVTGALRRTDPQAVLYRMTGDEFLVVLPDEPEENARQFFYAALRDFQNICTQNGYWGKLSFSGGAIRYVPQELDKEMALRQLEHSLEHAKSLGSGSYASFTQGIEQRHTRIQKIREALTQALEQDFAGFSLFYQPIMYSSNNHIYAVEALLRFYTDELGTVPPSEFIPILEESRDIRLVGAWVMEQAIRQKALWMKKYPHLTVGFNVSYLQLYTDELIDRIIETTERYAVDPAYIVVELTESCKVEYPESLAAMFERLRQRGFSVVLDDFGMEHSSFTLVRDLPVSCIKIDHSFVRTLTDSADRRNQVNLAIISSITYLCKQLGIGVVAEGIETPEVARMMAEMGVDYLQGYYYSRPVPVDALEMLIDSAQ